MIRYISAKGYLLLLYIYISFSLSLSQSVYLSMHIFVFICISIYLSFFIYLSIHSRIYASFSDSSYFSFPFFHLSLRHSFSLLALCIYSSLFLSPFLTFSSIPPPCLSLPLLLSPFPIFLTSSLPPSLSLPFFLNNFKTNLCKKKLPTFTFKYMKQD